MQKGFERLSGLLVGLLLAAAAQGAAAAGCKPACAVASSVVHAAGVPPDLGRALQQLEFKGTALAPGDAAAVKDIVRSLAALPAGAQMSLAVHADSALKGAAATRQAQARAQALDQAVRAGLKAAGAKAGVLKEVTASTK
jgi:hypothetical protein